MASADWLSAISTPAIAGVLEETIGALVVRHVDEGDYGEQTRMLTRRPGETEQVDVRRRLVDEGLPRAFERLQALDLELAQIRDRLGALDSRLPDRGRKVGLDRNVLGLVDCFVAFGSLQ